MISDILSSAQVPVLSAFLLGLLASLNPCQLAINISALTYLNHNMGSKATVTKGMAYTAGKSVIYFLLGAVLSLAVAKGIDTEAIGKTLEKSETIIQIALVIVGLFFIIRGFHYHEHHDNCHNCGTIIRNTGHKGAFVLGLFLAFTFCPESAVFFFGMTIPLSVKTETFISVPLAYSIGAALPVAVMAILLHKAKNYAQDFVHRFRHFQQVINIACGIMFISIAIIMFYI